VRKQNTKDFKKVERNKFLLRAKGWKKCLLRS
jgi:hypothetical protein